MSGVDDRIVSITFDNDRFERRIEETIASLDKLSESIRSAGTQEGLGNISDAANRLDVSSMAKGIENISSKFSALGAIGFAALQKITHGVLDFVKTTAGDILEPIISGGKQRAQNIEHAKFMFRGLGIDVEKGMKSALDAVLGTAYGLDEAAKAAAQFGASGIAVGPEMTNALRGVAGSAAMTGRSFTEMSDIFTGSAATGKVTMQDLQQFATRGLNAAAGIAKVLGKTEAQVREMASAGQLDFKTFSDAMNKAFGEHATKANETYAGSLANMRAAMSRLGASFFGPRLEQQRDLFNALTPVIDKVTAAIKPLFDTINNFGRAGTDRLVEFLKNLNFDNFNKAMKNFAEGLGNIFAAVGKVMGFFKEAFRDIFPKSATSALVSFSEKFLRFTQSIKMGGETANKIKDIFRGFFSILNIGKTIIVEIIRFFATLFGVSGGLGGGVLSLAATFGIMLQALNKFLVEGGAIRAFFTVLAAGIKVVIGFIAGLAAAIYGFFKGFKGGDAVEGSIGRVSSRLEHLGGVFEKLDTSRLGRFFEGVRNVFGGIAEYIGKWFSELGSKIAKAFGPGDFNAAIDIVNVGLLGGIIFMLKKFLGGGFGGVLDSLTGGLMEKVHGIFDGITGSLEAMQTKLKSEALMKIAIAIGILTASIVILSMIDSVALASALTAMAVGFGQLFAMMTLMNGIAVGPMGVGKITVLAGVLSLLALAMLLLSVSIKLLSTLSWNELAKGLVGVAVGLGLMIGAIALMPPHPGMIASGIALIAFAAALWLLSKAVKSFAELSWGELAKGLVGIGAGLVVVGLAMAFMPPHMFIIGLGLIAVAVGLRTLAEAVQAFADMSWAEMGKGLLGIGAGLVIVGLAMAVMPPNMILTSLGLLAVAASLKMMANAIGTLGTMKLGDIAKGLGALAIMLGILAVAMVVMSGTLAGAAAMIVAAGALLILSNVLERLGEMKIGDIIKALIALAGVFVILGVATLLLTPLIPAMIGLGVALGILGIAMALFGVGAYLVAKAFEMMANAGKAGVSALLEVIKMLITALPNFIAAFVRSLVQVAEELLRAVPLLLKVVTALLEQMLDTVIVLTPKIAEAIGAIISAGIVLLRAKFPELLVAGFELLIALLRGIKDNIVEVTTVAVQVVAKFAEALVVQIPTLVAAAVQILLAFLAAIAARAADIVMGGVNLILSFINGILSNIGKIIEIAGQIVLNFITGIASKAGELVAAGVLAVIKFVDGLASNALRVTQAGVDLVLKVLGGLASQTVEFARKAADIVISFLNGLAAVIREKTPELIKAGKNIATAIGDGMLAGLKEIPIIGKAVEMAQGIVSGIKGALGMKSPSKVFMVIGKDMIRGLAISLDRDNTAKNSAVDQAERIVKAFYDSLSKVPDSIAGLGDFEPVITPVLDLTKVEVASRDLNRLMSVSTITPDVSYDHARIISTTTDLGTSADATPVQTGPSEVIFEQNIYSPTELSTNDIYRSTKSQIILAKEELGIS